MKSLLWILFIFFSAGNLYSQYNPLGKPADYNNFIVEEQKKVLTKIIEYNIYTIHHDNFEEANQKRINIVRQLDASIERIKALSPFNDDSKLRDEASKVFSLYKDAYELEFNEINILRRERERSFEAMEKYIIALDKAEEKLKVAGDQFIKAQKEFAKKYQMNLTVNDTKNQLEDIIKINNYSRSIFLEYFRVYKIDAEFLDALNNQNFTIMDEKRNKIIQASEISLNKITNITPYNNDKTYKDKSLEILNYHIKLANNEYLELVTILKNKTSLTQKDIDRYNNIVTGINENSQKLITELNRENKEMLKRNLPLN